MAFDIERIFSADWVGSVYYIAAAERAGGDGGERYARLAKRNRDKADGDLVTTRSRRHAKDSRRRVNEEETIDYG